MKVICAPDSFKGSLTSTAAAEAMARGVNHADPRAEVDICPIGDGGEGTLAALQRAIESIPTINRTVSGLGRSINCETAIFPKHDFSYLESASVLGSAAENQSNVMAASSFGVGRLLLAEKRNPARVLVGLGGSLSNDGGTGLAQALGVQFFDRNGHLITSPLSGASLVDIGHINADSLTAALADTELTALCDVRNPFHGPLGAAHVFAPQKGATREEVLRLDQGLRHLCGLVHRDLGVDLQSVPGAGAAGGLGGGLYAFAGAKLAPGIETVLQVIGFNERIQGAQLVLTGEGCIDRQTLSGKACLGVAAAAKAAGIPSLALVGRRGDGADDCLASGLLAIDEIGPGLPAAESISRADRLLEKAAARALRYVL